MEFRIDCVPFKPDQYAEIHPQSSHRISTKRMLELSATKLTIAVVVTCFNQSRYTRRAVESLCRTTPDSDQFHFEFAVFDDCSTDDTAKVVRSISHGEVRHWPAPRNSGLTFLWNAAFREYSSCDYLAIVNNDVVFTPNWCFLILNALIARNASMGGPVTNSPGHVPGQDVRNFISDYSATDDYEEILKVSRQLKGCEPFELNRINGFCMVFDVRLLAEAQKYRPGEPFDPVNRNFGNEDEIQERLDPHPIVVPESFVFHYKRVSIQDGEGDYVRYRPPDSE
jgi:glycosyltransferase involved in cell wall biosynthesis